VFVIREGRSLTIADSNILFKLVLYGDQQGLAELIFIYKMKS
jgi:hypothetical protein